MKCDMCDKEASVFLTQIVDGKMTQANLCDQCSKDKGVTDPTGFQLADFLIGVSGHGKPKVEVAEDDGLACPSCGFTRAHLKKIGRLGCPECYQTFHGDLDNMLRAMHKGTRHVGKVPGKPAPAISRAVAALPAPPGVPAAPAAPTKAQIRKRIAELKDAIERAVAEERYEDAARLRDEMRELEAKKP